MRAVIFYLTTFGYIDGDFDDTEQAFVRDTIRSLVETRVRAGMPEAEGALRDEMIQKFTAHFHEVFEGIDHHVQELFTEAVARDEQQDEFIHAKLKLRCFEIFQGFDRANQESLLDTMNELIEADGHVHPAEEQFRNELVELFNADLDIELEEETEGKNVVVTAPLEKPKALEPHPFFDQFEFHYSRDTTTIARQIDADRALIDDVLAAFEKQREAGAGKLNGKASVSEFAGEPPFLDGHVYVHPVVPDAGYDLTVLGDLHGCYSCLKGAVAQTKFLDRVNQYKSDPKNTPKPLLVLLGDYIDRGLFSLNGVLRSVMRLFVSAPDHVFVLRGNHEYYLEYKGQIYGGVKPAEAINSLKPHLPIDVFRHYMRLFDAMPSMLLFDQLLFVHGGIPRDKLVKERWKDLSSLNDPDIRFQMMWSDPSSVDVVPAALQEQSARFPFGRLQAAAFLKRLGCHTLVRGHEKVNDGFKKHFDDPLVTLMTLFSAGGMDNADLPADSSYRKVTPKALTVSHASGVLSFTPWDIDYQTYNDPDRNAFFQRAPEIEHRTD